MADEPDRGALVIRFRPSDPDAVRRSALKEFRRSGNYRISIFADSRKGNESEGDLIVRLLNAAKLSNIAPEGNKRFWVCAQAASLFDAGFRFAKDNYPGEEPEHYSIDFGSEPTVEDTKKLVELFSDQRNWNNES